MEYSAWHSVIQDGNGAVVPIAKITVRNTSTGALAKLYSARDGSAPKANPFTADENGQVFFFVAGGAYTIKAEFGSQERTWPFVPVGTAAEYDIDSLALYLNSGVVYFQTRAELTTYAPLSYPAAAVILADPDALKNGYYTNSGTGWVFGRALQDTISRLFITGGAVNTPTANVGQGINPSAPLVFYVDVTAPNTASVTLNVIGLGQGVVLNAAGNPLAAGEWLGRVMLTRETDGRYRIMNDPASALSAAQSATEAGLARDVAVTAKNAAQSSASAASGSASAAATSAGNASGSATAAAGSATSASGSANTATTKANEAAASATLASTSAGTATTKAAEAVTSASNASGSATAASGSASAASGSATAAGTKASEAAASAAASLTSKNEALTARNESVTAKDASVAANTAAQDAKTAAETAKTQAVTNATNAGNSASAAADSAATANTKAGEASTSASAAAESATTATNQANRAETEADRAEAAAGGLINAVQYVPQTLTAPQQQQARTNIGVQPVSASTVGAVLAAPTPSETIADGDRLSGLDPTGTGLKLFRFSAVKTWIQSWLTKAMVGLGNVDNTSDASKPVSTAQQAALNTKASYNWIINGDFTINQRGGEKKPANGVYGFDRWKGHANGIEQIVEALPAGEYTLTWSGGGNGTFGGQTKASPIKATVSGGNASVVVPEAATKVSLVVGDAIDADPWLMSQRSKSIEEYMCQFYYRRPEHKAWFYATAGGQFLGQAYYFGRMRVKPTAALISTSGSSNATGISLEMQALGNAVGIVFQSQSSGGVFPMVVFSLDAEI